MDSSYFDDLPFQGKSPKGDGFLEKPKLSTSHQQISTGLALQYYKTYHNPQIHFNQMLFPF
jgi:hypothetical protein